MVRVKVCGIQTKEEIQECVRYGVDALGFVTEYPEPVPWNLGKERARELIEEVPPFVSSVIVTLGDRIREVLEFVNFTNADILQFHGEKNIEMVQELTTEIHSLGKKIIKSAYLDNQSKIFGFEDCGIDAVLVDSKTNERPGGTGEKVDWGTTKKLFNELEVPGILAGGLNPNNVKNAVSVVEPYAIDVLTGVENENHRKNPEKINKLVRNTRRDN